MRVGTFVVIKNFSIWTYGIFLIDDAYYDFEKIIRCSAYQVLANMKIFVNIRLIGLVLPCWTWLQIWNSSLTGYDKIHFRVKFLVFKLGLIRTVRPNLPWTVHQNSFLYMKTGNIENMREPLEPRSDLKNCSNRKLVQL